MIMVAGFNFMYQLTVTFPFRFASCTSHESAAAHTTS